MIKIIRTTYNDFGECVGNEQVGEIKEICSSQHTMNAILIAESKCRSNQSIFTVVR